MTKKSRELAEAELLFAALRIGCEANFNVILNSLNGKFYTRFEPQAKLVRTHEHVSGALHCALG